MIRNILSQADFDSSIRVPGLVVVDFYGDWCGPCRRIAPAVEQMSHRYPSVVFLKVNDKDCPDLVMSNGIRAFPTFQFFINGRKVDEMKGADEAQLEKTVTQWQAQAGRSSFAGAGNTLGGWDGVGAPPGADGPSAASTREARLKALGHNSYVAPPAAEAQPIDDEEVALQEALKLSLAEKSASTTARASAAAVQDAQDTADAEAELAEELRVAAADNIDTDYDEEMVPVPVDNTVLAQLLDFGFSDVRARKGLVHGKNNLESALAWLGEHEGDADIDQPYMVRKADAEKEMAPKVPLTPEEKARRVAELKAKIESKRKERENADKIAALANEKARREQGQNIQNIQEERDRLLRKREIERQKKEKEDEKRERERLRAEIARDKELRRANKGVLPSVLGVDGYNPSVGGKADLNDACSSNSAVPVAPQIAAEKPAAVVRSSAATAVVASISVSDVETKESALQKVDAALSTISRYRTGGDGGNTLKMLLLYIKNIVENPTESKYQTINMESKAFKIKVAPYVGPMQLFKVIGFSKNEEEQKLVLDNLDVELFREVLLRIQTADRIYTEKNGI